VRLVKEFKPFKAFKVFKGKLLRCGRN